MDSPELPCAFVSSSVEEARRVAVTAAILASASEFPNNLAKSLYNPFQSLFVASLSCRDDNASVPSNYDDGDDDDDASDAENERSELRNIVFQKEGQLFENLCTLGWVRDSRSFLHQPLMDAIGSVLVRKIQHRIAGDYETPRMTYAHTLAWKNSVVEPWLCDLILGPTDSAKLRRDSNVLRDRLTLCTAECYCRVRLREIFEMVTSFPDSMPAIVELRHVLEQTRMQPELQQALRESLTRRLTHPGADTSQMIDVYIATIKALRLLDTSTSADRLLSFTTEPVRAYLRGRSDTVRCIITSLTDAEAGGDLYQELRRQDAKPLENVAMDSDDEDECPTMQWQPPPSLLINQRSNFRLLGTSSRQSNTRENGDECDILAMLVSIYGSKELFVNEYRLMLADKLLANLDYNTDKEVHTLELLKLRFGEVSMVSAEVMIKDIEDSTRANKNIRDSLRTKTRHRSTGHESSRSDPVVDAAMISHIFWPKLQNEQLKHHPRIQAELDDFGSVYAEQKNPRKLLWMNQLGTVQLELDVVEGDESGAEHIETKEFNCSPLLATLISHFEDKQSWTAEELSNETGVPETRIQKSMSYWITQRVVTLSTARGPNVKEYVLATKADQLLLGDHRSSHGILDDDAHGNQAVSALAQEEEDMEVCESYISVMLTSLHQAPLEKIHNMLHMMSGSGSGAEGTYNKTPQQLSAFLQHLCRQEKLECGPDGMYKLVKK